MIEELESVVELKVAPGEPAQEPATAAPNLVADPSLPSFGDDFETLNLIAQDCLGELYLVRNTKLGRELHARLIPAESLPNEEARKAFLRFCRRYMTVSHPSMASMYSFHDEERGIWFLMEPIAGTSMESLIKNGEFKSTAKLSAVFEQLIACIQALHQVGIRFGAMPSAGIFIEENENGHTIRLRDWWAYALHQAQGDEKIDETADIYSFGSLMYEAIMGKKPYTGSDPQKIAIAIMNSDSPQIEGDFAKTPFARLVQNCLHKDRARRYANFEDLQLDFKSASRGAPLPSVRAQQNTDTSSVRARGVAITIGLALVLSAFLSWFTHMLGSFDMYDPPVLQGATNGTITPTTDLEEAAFTAESNGDLASAEVQWQKLVDQQPSDANAWYNLGRVQSDLNEYAPALKSLNKAVGLDPVNGEAWSELARLNLDLANGPQAELAFGKAIELDPENSSLYAGLALVQFQLNQFDAAIKSAKKAVDLDPSDAETRFSLAFAYETAGKYTEAAKEYETALSFDPKYATLWNNLSGVYSHLGKHTQAIEAANKAVEIDPSADSYWSGLGHAHLKANNLKDAESAYQTALKINQFDYKSWLDLSEVYKKMGKGGEAKKARKKAME